MSQQHIALREEYFRRLDALVRDACQRWQEQAGMHKPGASLRVDYFLENALIPSGRTFWRRARDGAKDLNVPALVSEKAFNDFCGRVELYAEPQQLTRFREFVGSGFLHRELKWNTSVTMLRNIAEMFDDIEPAKRNEALRLLEALRAHITDLVEHSYSLHSN